MYTEHSTKFQTLQKYNVKQPPACTAYRTYLESTMDSAFFNSEQPRRTFPPLYQSSGDEAQDRLAFIHILERLKVSIHLDIGNQRSGVL